jgi:hypothetical protein
MNFHLLKYFIKKNWLVWLGVLAFIHMELLVCIFMMELIADMMSKIEIPGLGTFDAGITVDGEYALTYVSGLFPMYMCMFPMIFFIITIHKLMSKAVDTTALSPILATGITRRQYILTVAAFIGLSLFAMFFVTFLVCGLAISYWGAFNWWSWLNLNLSFLFVNLAVAAICLFFSSTFAAGRAGLALTVGVPVVFLIFHMLSDFLKGFKYFTLYGWVDSAEIAAGTFNLWWLWILFYSAIAVGITVATIFVFRKKQLSL